MPCFKIEIPGHLYRKWPSGKEIMLTGCCFTPGNNDRELVVQTKIDAENEEQARKNGRKICFDATHLLEFCIGESVYLDERRDSVRKKGNDVTTGRNSFSHNAVLIKNSPLTTEQLEAVEKTQNALTSEKDREKKESLLRAIHWQAIGRRETKSKIDHFIKFWIALKVLIDGKGKDVVKKVEGPLLKLYPSCPEQKIKDVVGRIYGIREKIVHYGIREPESAEEKLKQLEAILGDLLKLRLGLNFKALAQQYLLQLWAC